MRPIFAQEYFTEEFNQTRPGGQIDSNKWTVYENRPSGCAGDLIKETGGYVTFIQCSNATQFPYVISKNDPFPAGDFSTSIKFQYTNVRAWGTGIQIANSAPQNGSGFTSLFSIGVWEDNSLLKMRLNFKDQQVYTTPINIAPHELKIDRVGSIYKLYFDDQLVFTSSSTLEKVHAIYMGNPSIQTGPPFPGWTWFKVDSIKVTDNGPSEIAPQPFLDLPWDYNANTMTFNEAATSINSFFDHEYPLLSVGLSEPQERSNDLMNYKGVRSERYFYSSHDGYDYGNSAKTKFDTPVLAAADGEATYLSPQSCGACGNAILIDHKNGFQTRYYHLQPSGLIVNIEGQKINVLKGQQIGKVGYSGNVHPSGIDGSHIHFMVIQDKNNDGNFQDNIPDGLVDPFGWQSPDPDPWEIYNFNYAGQARTGNKSYYLFTKQLDNLDTTLSSNQAVFNVGKTKLEFPAGSTNQNLNITANSAPNFVSNILNSLGSILKIEAKNSAGQLISSFSKNFNLTIDFSQFDLNRFNTDTLSIYSSQDGENWTRENTQVDLNEKIASTSLNHLTYFALMAERKDSVAPTTIANLQGQSSNGNNFRSNVNLNLNASDNPGGLGVEYTTYSIGENNWQTYTTPLTFSNEGNYKVYFYSEDKDGSVEELKSVEFSIDKTIPEAKIAIDLGDYDLKVSSVSDSGVTITRTPGKKLNEATYILKDLAGNSLTLEAFDKDGDNSDLFKLYSLKYNDQAVFTLPSNSFETTYTFQPKPGVSPVLRLITQSFELKDQATFVINADASKNKTTLNIVENKKPRREEKSGAILLKLQTNKGKLEYSY